MIDKFECELLLETIEKGDLAKVMKVLKTAKRTGSILISDEPPTEKDIIRFYEGK